MARIALDFNKINHNSYRVYRVMQASDTWSKIYRHRIELLSPYRTAIIFPESILGLNQKYVYYCIKRDEGSGSLCTIVGKVPITGFSIVDRLGNYDERFTNIGQIELLEKTDNPRDVLKLSNSGHPFVTTPLFSGKKDVIRFAAKTLGDMVNSQL